MSHLKGNCLRPMLLDVINYKLFIGFVGGLQLYMPRLQRFFFFKKNFIFCLYYLVFIKHGLQLLTPRKKKWFTIKHTSYLARYGCIKEKVVAFIVRKMWKSCLRWWFGHVWRRHIEASLRRIDEMVGSPVIRNRERPEKL